MPENGCRCREVPTPRRTIIIIPETSSRGLSNPCDAPVFKTGEKYCPVGHPPWWGNIEDDTRQQNQNKNRKQHETQDNPTFERFLHACSGYKCFCDITSQ
jgi:hypothetical protein